MLQREKETELKLEEERIIKEKESEEAKIQALKDAENAILDIRSQPLRQYLADCVIPYLTEGLIQIYKGNPENPLEFLVNSVPEMKIFFNKIFLIIRETIL